jgi:hypothetical protein
MREAPMKKIIRVISFAALLTLGTGRSFAQVPNFSGEWKLNFSKCALPGSFDTPEMTWVIRQEGVLLTIERRIRREVKIRRYSTDGNEFLNVGSGIRDLKGTAVLVSGKLTVKTEEEVITVLYSPDFPDGNTWYHKINMVEEYSLSEDGKTLNVTQVFETPKGESNSMKLVFDKIGG